MSDIKLDYIKISQMNDGDLLWIKTPGRLNNREMLTGIRRDLEQAGIKKKILIFCTPQSWTIESLTRDQFSRMVREYNRAKRAIHDKRTD